MHGYYIVVLDTGLYVNGPWTSTIPSQTLQTVLTPMEELESYNVTHLVAQQT